MIIKTAHIKIIIRERLYIGVGTYHPKSHRQEEEYSSRVSDVYSIHNMYMSVGVCVYLASYTADEEKRCRRRGPAACSPRSIR